MKDNRDMFYSDYQAGGYMYPNNMNPNMNMYSGYSMGNQVPQNIPVYNNPNTNNNYYDANYLDSRILKLERATKRLESRVTRLENLSGNTIDDLSSSDNLYMI